MLARLSSDLINIAFEVSTDRVLQQSNENFSLLFVLVFSFDILYFKFIPMLLNYSLQLLSILWKPKFLQCCRSLSIDEREASRPYPLNPSAKYFYPGFSHPLDTLFNDLEHLRQVNFVLCPIIDSGVALT